MEMISLRDIIMRKRYNKSWFTARPSRFSVGDLSLRELLDFSFQWGKSSEGHEFWRRIHNSTRTKGFDLLFEDKSWS